MGLIQGTEIRLTNGDVLVLDNDMNTNKSCTEWDVRRFEEEGLLVKEQAK